MISLLPDVLAEMDQSIEEVRTQSKQLESTKADLEKRYNTVDNQVYTI